MLFNSQKFLENWHTSLLYFPSVAVVGRQRLSGSNPSNSVHIEQEGKVGVAKFGGGDTGS